MEYYYNLAFDVYFYNDKVGRVVLEGTRLVENRCYLDLEEEKFPHFKYPLIYMKDGRAVRDWLAGRVVPRERADIDAILGTYGLDEYNVYKICEKTNGVMVDSPISVRFEGSGGIESRNVISRMNYVLDRGALVGGETTGVQEKYKRGNQWYKVDKVGGEGFTEHLVSLLLGYSDLPVTDIVKYEWCTINGRKGCRSRSFLKQGETFISFEEMYRILNGGDLSNDLYVLPDAYDRYTMLVGIAKRYCGLDVGGYLARCFYLDLLIENRDRHLRNIGIIQNSRTEECRTAPLFDSGLSLGTGVSEDAEVQASTISGSFEDQVVACSSFPCISPFRVDFSSFLREVTNRGYGNKPQVRKLRGLIMLYEDIF